MTQASIEKYTAKPRLTGDALLSVGGPVPSPIAGRDVQRDAPAVKHRNRDSAGSEADICSACRHALVARFGSVAAYTAVSEAFAERADGCGIGSCDNARRCAADRP